MPMHRLFSTLIVVAMSGVVAIPAAAARTEQAGSSLAPIVRTERVGTGVIRVVYDLSGPPSATFTVVLEASNDGAQTFLIQPRATSGDVGANVSPGMGKAIVWESTKDVDDLQVDRYVFRVLVTPGAVASSGSAAPTASAGPAAAPAAATPASGKTAAVKKGGGLSKGALIAIAGGGAAAGVGVAAAKGGGGSSASTAAPGNTTPTTTHRNFTANVSFPISFTFNTCVRGEMWTGTILLSLDLSSSGTVTGNATVNISTLVTSITASCPASQLGGTGTVGLPLSAVTGTTSRIVFSGNRTQATGGPTVNKVDDWNFAGSLASDVVTGTMMWTVTYTGDGQAGNQGVGSATFNVSAR